MNNNAVIKKSICFYGPLQKLTIDYLRQYQNELFLNNNYLSFCIYGYT